jgi:rsbT co-antagonist protein RsbR
MIGLIDAARARQMTEQLLAAVRRQRAAVVVIDITGVAAMDSAVANHLVNTVEAARLLGARVIVSGVSTAIAGTLVQIGVDLGKLVTMGDLQSGIEEANRFLGVEVVSIDRKKAAPPAAAAPGPRAPKPSAGPRPPEGKGSGSAGGGQTPPRRKQSA